MPPVLGDLVQLELIASNTGLCLGRDMGGRLGFFDRETGKGLYPIGPAEKFLLSCMTEELRLCQECCGFDEDEEDLPEPTCEGCQNYQSNCACCEHCGGPPDVCDCGDECKGECGNIVAECTCGEDDEAPVVSGNNPAVEDFRRPNLSGGERRLSESPRSCLNTPGMRGVTGYYVAEVDRTVPRDGRR